MVAEVFEAPELEDEQRPERAVVIADAGDVLFDQAPHDLGVEEAGPTESLAGQDVRTTMRFLFGSTSHAPASSGSEGVPAIAAAGGVRDESDGPETNS